MEISVISFTDKGKKLSRTVFGSWTPEKVLLFSKKDQVMDVKAWTGEQFREKRAIVFVGACGIAVRMTAPWIKDKLTDSPVIVMDETGLFVIPILSGHMGGANELAERIAQQAGAVPVITTATDVNETFAVDVFAKRQNLSILNKDGIARVSSKVLKGEMVDIVIAADDEQLSNGILRLKPKEYVLGIGCRRGKPYEEIRDFVDKELKKIAVSMQDVRAVASIDRKKDEEGILRFANANRLPFVTFSAEQLEQVRGWFVESDFVKNNVGVGNVCERAAMAEAGAEGRLILHKTAENGMTLAVAYAPWHLKTGGADRLVLEKAQSSERKERKQST